MVKSKMQVSEPSSNLVSSRRKAIKQLSLLFTGALSASSISLAVQGYQPKPDDLTRKGLVLNHQQLMLLKEIVDLILPATDTPAASAVDVHGFIDHQLYHCFSEQERTMFVVGLTRLEREALAQFKRDFSTTNENLQVHLLTQMESAEGEFTQQDERFFQQLKSLTLLGYYTSEIGATQELSYLAIPGGYNGNISFASVGKAWAF